MTLNYFVLICVGLWALGSCRNIPDYIHTCKRSDPQVAKCIRDSVEVLRPRLKAGIPELGVPALDPLVLDKIVLFRGDSPGSIRASLNNVKAHGAGDFQITKLKVDVEKNTYRVGLKFPKIVAEGEYDVDAKILSMPIVGSGKFSATINDIDGQAVVKAELIDVDNHREIRFTSFDLSVKIGDYDLNIENLFNGDKALSQAITDVMRDNKQQLIQTAMPFIRIKASQILLEEANKITKDIDYDEVFPEK